MDNNFTTAIVLSMFFFLLIIGLPVAFCLISTSIICTLIFWSPAALYMSATTVWDQSTKDIYLAIPMFVFLASMLEASGIAENLYKMFDKWIGRLRGSLGITSVLMCTILDAISGLGASGIVTIGPIALPEMMKRKYSKQIALGAIAAGSALGPLIPPSVIMIIISGYTGLSVGKLFAGGLFPGFLCSAGFIIYIVVLCHFRPKMGPALASDVTFTWRDKFASLNAVIAPLLLICSIMGGIYSGICTPTEGAAVGAFGAMICAALNRRLTFKDIYAAGKISIKVTCMVMWLLIGGNLFAGLLSALQVTDALAQVLANVYNGYGSFGLMAVMMVIVFIMGMFIDGAAITVLTMPIFFPAVMNAGIDPLWFGILFTINVVIGYLTPPFGMNLFYMKGITPPEVSMMDIYKSIIPYVLIMILVMLITWSLPEIATWLPSTIDVNV